MSNLTEVNFDDLSAVVANKDSLYNAMIRNGYYLPNKKSKLVTIEYMLQVRKGTIHCPKYEDIRLAPCPDLPSKEDIFKALFDLVEDPLAGGQNLGFKREDVDIVDAKWCLDLLSTLKRDHPFFQKQYYPTSKIPKSKKVMIDKDNETFLTGLPKHVVSKMKSSRKIKKVNKTVMGIVKQQIPAAEKDILIQSLTKKLKKMTKLAARLKRRSQSQNANE